MITKKSKAKKPKVSLRYRNKFGPYKHKRSKSLFSSIFGKSLFRKRRKFLGLF